MRMRFRTDGWHYAELKALGKTFEDYFGSREFRDIPEREATRKAWDETPKAEPGDVWRVHWHSNTEEHGPLAGYAICCAGCGKIHHWTVATNCEFQKVEHSYIDQDGKEQRYSTCGHAGICSCWEWTGSAEEGTLSGKPSLKVNQEDCQWHGYLTNGELHT